MRIIRFQRSAGVILFMVATVFLLAANAFAAKTYFKEYLKEDLPDPDYNGVYSLHCKSYDDHPDIMGATIPTQYDPILSVSVHCSGDSQGGWEPVVRILGDEGDHEPHNDSVDYIRDNYTTEVWCRCVSLICYDDDVPLIPDPVNDVKGGISRVIMMCYDHERLPSNKQNSE